MQIGFQHQYHRSIQKNKQTSRKKIIETMDKFIYLAGIFTVIIFIPQFIDVWVKNDISGVSLLSWLGLFISSCFWILYGYIHKAKPIMFMNILSGLIQFFIILGILMRK